MVIGCRGPALVAAALARLLADLGMDAARPWIRHPAAGYPTLFALAAVHGDIGLEAAAGGYLWAWTENQVAAAIKLVPLGQTAGQRLLGRAVAAMPAAVARGLALVISGLAPIYFASTPEFNESVMGSTLGSIIPGADIPNIVLVLFGAAIVAAFILSRTVLGRYTYALGSNEEAVRLSGVNVDRWKAAVFTIGGLFAGLGGVLLAARVNSAQPSLGFGYELEAISAVVIGGTSLFGGRGEVRGALLGAVMIGTLQNGLNTLNVSNGWIYIITGLVLLLAVTLDTFAVRLQARSGR